MLRKFQITAAILSLVVGGLMFITSIILSSMLHHLIDMFNEAMAARYEAFIVCLMMASLAVIILSIFFYHKKYSIGLPIALIGLLAASALFEINGDYMSSTKTTTSHVILCIVAIGFYITYLCLKIKEQKILKSKESLHLMKGNNVVPQIKIEQPTNQNETIGKIHLLIKLKDLGEISKQEFKELLIKELNPSVKIVLTNEEKVKESNTKTLNISTKTSTKQKPTNNAKISNEAKAKVPSKSKISSKTKNIKKN